VVQNGGNHREEGQKKVPSMQVQCHGRKGKGGGTRRPEVPQCKGARITRGKMKETGVGATRNNSGGKIGGVMLGNGLSTEKGKEILTFMSGCN